MTALSKYTCPTCSRSWIGRHVVSARCMICGSSELSREAAPPHATIEIRKVDLDKPAPADDGREVSRLVCIDCARSFLHDHSCGTPVCAHCSSPNCKEISPRVTAVGIAQGQFPVKLSRREIKRQRFIRKGWEARMRFADAAESVVAMLDRLGVDSVDVQQALARALIQVDKQQTAAAAEYGASSGA